ncbi:MAG: hypothetical protein ABI567_11925 [Gammaproteobacteria bacterium]
MSVRNLAIVATIAVLTAAACGKARPPQAQDASPVPGALPDTQSAALSTALAAATGPAALPATVVAALADLAAQCSGVEGTPHTEQAVQQGDLNGDGQTDFVLYAGWINCENAASIYGDREKFLAVFAGDGSGGAAEAFSGQVFDAKIEGTGASARLWLSTMGEGCGQPPAADFASESFCDRAIDWKAGTGRFEYAPVATVRMLE